MAITDIIAPILFCILIGGVSGKLLQLKLDTLSKLSLYVLTPCLTFSLLIKIQLTSLQALEIVVFTIIHLVLGLAVIAIVLKLTSLPHKTKVSAVLSAIFMNSANYGLPVVLFAFGQLGMERAIIFVVTQLVLFNSLGVFLGANTYANWLKAIKRVFYLPTIYAVVLVVLIRATGISFPETIISAVGILGQGAIPIMLILLGAQLATKNNFKDYRLIAGISVYRLLISPLLAYLLLLYCFKMQDALTYKVLIIESAMPTAVNNILLAMEFKGDPELISGIILFTTLFSFITLSLIISLLL